MSIVLLVCILIMEVAIIPLLIGFYHVALYYIKKLKTQTKFWVKFFVNILLVFGISFSIIIPPLICHLLSLIKIGEYIAVIIYIALLTVLASNSFYQSPKTVIDTAYKAFKSGFTQFNVWLSKLPLKTIINVVYLAILIIAQIQDLGYYKFPEELSHFLTLNKYGLLIIWATEKIIKSVKPDMERAKILKEAFEEQKKRDKANKEKEKNLIKYLIGADISLSNQKLTDNSSSEESEKEEKSDEIQI